ncbi:MAG: hypothetical protein COW29_00095 [Rhodobacterales bacterium CG15_BIG_FIL_POST_REV_8_21_14_020_59_13]|nr:MAG: hypothetical protein COW29_00095 [Rhodobacterales bacterium CG15_BIG_FIL_POST_REV_8_21_14_020_59_13]
MIRYLMAFILVAVGIHAATVWYLPRLAMKTAMARFEESGLTVNEIAHVPPTDETSRRVVRPSPDLLYSVCILDLSGGPVRIRAAGWDGYMSLSLFAANTDNVAAFNNSQIAGDISVTIGQNGVASVALGSERGIALIRRLAVDDASMARADAVRREGDICEGADPS